MDSRLTKISNFTSTRHSSAPSSLDPSLTTLPENYTVLILGASQGIGLEIARSYAHARASTIIIASRSLPDLQSVASNITTTISPSVTIDCQTCDISSSDSVSALASYIASKYPRLDTVICNAAYPGPVVLKIHEGDPEWVQRAFDVNAIGTYLAAHFFVPLLLRPITAQTRIPADETKTEHGAKLFLTVGTLAALIRRGPIANTGYCVSKLAQARLVELLDEQYGSPADGGLLAVNVHPGAVPTDSAMRDAPKEFLQYLTDSPSLCGAVLVRISRDREDWKWLGGRLISANWDLDELSIKKEEVVKGDLLKFALLG